jgi:trehalose 6-phosphate phosphatase
MRHLFHSWSHVARRLRAGRPIALFLDFDGTLTPLRPRPEDVWLDEATRSTLTHLARSPRFRVWVVSGRRRADIRARVRVPGIRYLGLHGWEGRASNCVPEETRRVVVCAKNWLGSLLLNTPGIWIEDKEMTFAIHYRSVSEKGVRKARQLLHGVLEAFEGLLHLVKGKKVWEVVPHEMEDKGAAVKQELSAIGREAVPVYIGDDRMDEPGFDACSSGVTVRVGRACRSKARYRLSSVAQVRRFLEDLGREFA